MKTATMAMLLAAAMVAMLASTAAGMHSSGSASKDPLTHQFIAWMKQHEKSYDAEEFLYRWSVWREQYLYIEAHNRVSAFSLGLNAFSDMRPEEFNTLYKGLLPVNTASRLTAAAALPRVKDVSDLPESFDWREKGAVTHVKNQGQCGSCWSFSTTGSTEGINAITNKTTIVSLSEQNLIDCSTSYGNQGCNGGLMDNAFQYIIANGGIDTEASYPYTTSGPNTCEFNRANVGGNIDGYTDVASGDEHALHRALAGQPISVAIDASHNSFQSYSGEVYYEAACSSTSLDHGVLAVGWGISSAQEYWIVKNSWGSAWGLSGYIWMSRNRNNNCGIATMASYPTLTGTSAVTSAMAIATH